MRASLVVLAMAALLVLIPWAGVLYQRFMPRSLERRAILGFLHAARWGYATLLVLAPSMGLLGLIGLLKARARRTPWRHWASLFVVGATFTLMIPPSEFVAGRWLGYMQRIPQLPEQFEVEAISEGGESRLSLVVVGGSTAEGQPYHPKLSMGQLVGWFLESLLDGREVDVDVRATGGICLEQAVLTLTTLDRKPDVVLICSGHNEFQARYGWSRNVRHYVDEGEPAGRSELSVRLGRISSVSEMIERTIDRNEIDRPPPPRITRQLIDRPAFTKAEYDFLLDDYARRLDALLAYCRKIGAVPIVVVPASNLLDYPPARSYLAPETDENGRRIFEETYLAAREREESDPDAAIVAYRRLIDSHPTFAELHYRYGRLLGKENRVYEARDHLARARDLDGMPMRCPSDFEDSCRQIARRHNAVLIDGHDVLAELSEAGIPGDDVLHDAHHPTLPGYLAMARAVVHELASQGALGVESTARIPDVEPSACAEIFGVDQETWVTVAERSTSFWTRTAYMRFDPSKHLRMAEDYSEAARKIRAGANPADLGIAALRLDRTSESSTAVDVADPNEAEEDFVTAYGKRDDATAPPWLRDDRQDRT